MSEPLVSQFINALDKVVDQFRDQGITVAEAIGCLALLQAQIIQDGLESEEGE